MDIYLEEKNPGALPADTSVSASATRLSRSNMNSSSITRTFIPLHWFYDEKLSS